MTATSVAVLNTTYEHISFTRVGRAVALVLRGDAVIEESVPERILRHRAGELPYPKTIRLLRYIKLTLDYRPATWSKQGVLKRDNFTCGYCLKHATTIDHITPVSRNGARRDWLNTVASCTRCNAKKADRTPKEARMTLRFQPTQPVSTRIKVSVDRRRR
jgi:hypothetical protein